MKKTIAIYAGSFNPFHLGHANIVKKAQDIFGKENVLVSFGMNPDKSIEGRNAENSRDSQNSTISEKLSCETDYFEGFLHEYIERVEKERNCNVVIVKGLRNGDDLAYEEKQLRVMKDLKPDIKVMFLMCDIEYAHISSSMIRSLNKIKRGSGNIYLI